MNHLQMFNDTTGDLYNIIYDDSLWPLRTAEPADYAIQPPIDIGEVVTRRHITDFFIDFMKNDALGRIATLHMTLADQKELGTFDTDCITLASLHSTAVDFSKTGIPVSAIPTPSAYMVRNWGSLGQHYLTACAGLSLPGRVGGARKML